MASLSCPLLDSICVQIEFLGDLCIREIASHEIPTQDPQSKRLMMASTDGVSPIVETSLAGLAQGALTRGLRIVAPLVGELRAFTMGTLYPVWPASATDGFKTLGVVDERLHVYHGASIAQRFVRNKGPRPGRSSA
jgi:hypothetical protein